MFTQLRLKHPGSSLLQIAFFNLCRKCFHAIFIVLYRRRCVGLDRVPKTGGVLLVANHQSFLDPPFIGGCLATRDTDFLARGGLFKFKPFAWIISTLNATPIKQGAGDTGAMKETIKRLNEGKAMVVFPEGSRTPDGELKPFARGISVLIKRADCVIVPVGIAGVFDVWPRHKKLPRLFTRPVAIVYGDPIDSNELMADGADTAIETLYTQVNTLVEQAESLR